jgi:hypothetical protein
VKSEIAVNTGGEALLLSYQKSLAFVSIRSKLSPIVSLMLLRISTGSFIWPFDMTFAVLKITIFTSSRVGFAQQHSLYVFY